MCLHEPARFYLYRREDLTGVSGTGIVAWGVRFRDGVCVLHWGNYGSTTVWPNLLDLIKVHGHGGRTIAVFLEDNCECDLPEETDNG